MELANQWLAALEVAQIASNRYCYETPVECCGVTYVTELPARARKPLWIANKLPPLEPGCVRRLVWALNVVEANLDFWVERLRQGQHLRTMLFGQGPVSFARDVYLILAQRRHEHQLTATDRLEQRVGSPPPCPSAPRGECGHPVMHPGAGRSAEGPEVKVGGRPGASACRSQPAAPTACPTRRSGAAGRPPPVLGGQAGRHGLRRALHQGPALSTQLAGASEEDPGHEPRRTSLQAYTDIDLYAAKQFRRLLGSHSDLRQTALTQMLVARSKRMFRIGSAASVQEAGSLASNGRRERCGAALPAWLPARMLVTA